MNQFIVWIFCLTPEYNKPLTGSFVEKGYQVSSASGASPSTTKGITTILAYSLVKNIGADDFKKDLISLLQESKIYYYGFVCSAYNGRMFWNVGNIDGETDISRVLQMKALW